MNALELMRDWPGLATASPAELLASPAWRLETEFDGSAATLHVAESAPDDEILLSISLDDRPHVLGLSRASLYPDLDALWSRRASLPEPLLVALVEKECGGVLQFLENLLRQELKLKGVAAEKGIAKRTDFTLDGRAGRFGFSLDLPAAVVEELGVFENLDSAHPAIADLTRGVRGVYRTFEGVTATDLKDGDFLLLPEATGTSLPRWEMALPDDGAVRLVLAEPRAFAFRDFANDALPGLPEVGRGGEDASPTDLALAVGSTLRFAAVPTKVGAAPALKLSSL